MSIADQVAMIARKELAPHALAIDEGTLYPEAMLRSSAKPERGAATTCRMAQPICAAPLDRLHR